MRSAYLSLSLDTESDAERVYALLSDDGEIFMKLEQTPFAIRFAMLRDRFGHFLDAAASTRSIAGRATRRRRARDGFSPFVPPPAVRRDALRGSTCGGP